MGKLLLLFCVFFVTSGATSGVPVGCLSKDQPRDTLIPAGTTIIGDDEAYPEEGGAHQVDLTAFRMDIHEVTNRQFEAFVAETGYVTDAERMGDSIVFVAPAASSVDLHDPSAWWKIVEGANWRRPFGPDSSIRGRDDLPVVQVSYADALAYAQWAGRALPTEAQFEYAARAGSVHNDHEPPPKDAANTWQGRFPDLDAGDDGYKTIAPVGCYKPNAYGLYDMLGNVWEWTSSIYTRDHHEQTIAIEDQHVVKGGSYLCTSSFCARYRPAARQAQDVHGATSHIGFRTIAF